MRQCLVAVVDGSKARFFTFSSGELDVNEAAPELVEQDPLHNAEKGMPGKDLWANTKTGRNQGRSGQAHSYDDHRSNHMAEFERRFAQSIMSRILDLSQTTAMQHLVLVAEPQILGMIRHVIPSSLSSKLTVYEVAKDLCWMNTKQLHTYLAERSLLPAFNRVGV